MQRFYSCIAPSAAIGMGICYQYESANFSAPYADNQLLCSLCGLKQSHPYNNILRASNTTTRFSTRSIVQLLQYFIPRLHQKRSQKVRNLPGGMPPDSPNRHATCILIAYWNPLFQNSRSATALPYPLIIPVLKQTKSDIMKTVIAAQFKCF